MQTIILQTIVSRCIAYTDESENRKVKEYGKLVGYATDNVNDRLRPTIPVPMRHFHVEVGWNINLQTTIATLNGQWVYIKLQQIQMCCWACLFELPLPIGATNFQVGL